MAQLGILFDAQKLGSGFYGYTAFRILFSVIPPKELGGCTLYHGEVGDGRARPYCIAIESDSVPLLARLRKTLSASMARGLLPPNERFLDDAALCEEVLAMAARITAGGEMADCSSRWLQEAWQRAQGQQAQGQQAHGHHAPVQQTLAPQEEKHPAARPLQDLRTPPKLPVRVPAALRCSTSGRKALAFLLAFCVGGALIPWAGWGLASCAMIFTAGMIEAFAIRWRLWAMESICGSDVLIEVKKLLASKPLPEAADKLNAAGAAASPLLRRLQATMRAADLNGSCVLADQLQRSDRAVLRADVWDVHLKALGVLAAAGASLAAMWVFQGPAPTMTELPRIALAAWGGFCLLYAAAKWIEIRAERLEAHIRSVLILEWMPVLVRIMPGVKGEGSTADRALQELTKELQQLHTALDRRRDGEFVETMASLRNSVDQLAPVLAGFREPFVLQAVPMNVRGKVLSATG